MLLKLKTETKKYSSGLLDMFYHTGLCTHNLLFINTMFLSGLLWPVLNKGAEGELHRPSLKPDHHRRRMKSREVRIQYHQTHIVKNFWKSRYSVLAPFFYLFSCACVCMSAGIQIWPAAKTHTPAVSDPKCKCEHLCQCKLWEEVQQRPQSCVSELDRPGVSSLV